MLGIETIRIGMLLLFLVLVMLLLLLMRETVNYSFLWNLLASPHMTWIYIARSNASDVEESKKNCSKKMERNETQKVERNEYLDSITSE